MLAVRKILVPIDWSETSNRAFHLACSLARDHGAELVLLHVVPLAVMTTGPAPGDYLDHMREELTRTAATEPGICVQPLVLEGDPARAILEVARETHCNAIVMGTHGRTGLGHLLMGSVAEQVVRNAPCAVLTVKSPAPSPGEPATC
jgi:nucleotide-binding universal stress UspA family protein